MQLHERKLSDITPYDKNPRHNNRAVDAVAASIKEFGFKVPIVVDADGTIINGHTRHKAAIKLGLKTVPVLVADDLDDEQVKAFRLADNRVGEIATWDTDMLLDELAAIAEFDMREFGFTGADFEAVVDAVDDDFAMPTEAHKLRCAPGEIWELGVHRLIVGDATSDTDLFKLTDGASVDAFITDPPYNVDYEGGTGLKIEGDKQDDASFLAFLTDAFTAACNTMKPGAAFYIWHASTEAFNFITAARAAGLDVKQTIVWVKNAAVMGRQDYHWKHEPCLYGWKPGAEHYFTFDRTQNTVFDDEPNIRAMGKAELIAYIEDLRAMAAPEDVMRENKPSRNKEHPTMKPIPLMGRLISNSTKRGQIVLDTFAGSGSTLIAAEQLGRRCFAAELDPKYATVIVERWEAFTGQTAIKIEG